MRIEKDPYWYTEYLINRITKLINREEYYEAFLNYLTEHNHGHSGFTESEEKLFLNPQNNTEQEFSSTIFNLHLQIVQGLLRELSQGLRAMELHQIEDRVTAIYSCLLRLENVGPYPSELLSDFKTAYEQSLCMGAMHEYHKGIIDNWIALNELSDYKELRKTQDLFISEHCNQGITSVRLWHCAQFFSHKPEECYINDHVLAHMREVITGEAFLLVDFLRERTNRELLLPTLTMCQNVQVYEIYKDDWKPQLKL